MTLLPDWKALLKRAWSVRMAALAAALSAAEVVLPLFFDLFTRGTFAALAGLAAAGGLVARILAQPEAK